MTSKPTSPVTEGSTVGITCQTDASNAGPPGIQWFRNGQEVFQNINEVAIPVSETPADQPEYYYSSNLTISARREDNQATYECRVSRISNQENFKKVTNLHVYCKFIKANVDRNSFQ